LCAFGSFGTRSTCSRSGIRRAQPPPLYRPEAQAPAALAAVVSPARRPERRHVRWCCAHTFAVRTGQSRSHELGRARASRGNWRDGLERLHRPGLSRCSEAVHDRQHPCHNRGHRRAPGVRTGAIALRARQSGRSRAKPSSSLHAKPRDEPLPAARHAQSIRSPEKLEQSLRRRAYTGG
jgi:hypothetical protein